MTPITDRPGSPVFFVVPGRIDTRTGGSIYNRRMGDGLRRLGWAVEILELDPSFPFPGERALAHAATTLAAVPGGAIVIVDGLALGAMPDLVAQAARRLCIVALVHLPLAADAAFDDAALTRFETGERQALAAATLIVVTGAAALPMLARYELSRDRVLVVEPGTDHHPVARGSTGGPLRLLSVATLNPGKGHDLLLHALAGLRDTGWRLTCAGSLTRHPPTVERVRATMRTLRLEDRVELVGELDATGLAAAYDASDVFVLATRQETYGMAVAEALAHGLPVVATATGAIPALVGDEAGVVVPPENVGALAGALRRVLGDAALRASLADGARRVRERLPSWDHAAGRLSAALAGVHADG